MFLQYDQNQSFLLPPSYKDFLWDNHEAVLLNEFIENLDTSKLVSTCVKNNKWRPKYHPVLLLKILFYGYMTQTFSSRKIAHKLKSDIWFMFLAANNKPDFRTINRFRKDQLTIIQWLFTQVVLLAKKLWLVTFGTVNLDWTKIYANASTSQSYDLERIAKISQKLVEEAERIDELEDEEFWDDDWNNIPEHLRTKEWRDQKLKEISQEKHNLAEIKKTVESEILAKKEQGINQSRINLTDIDARLMQMKRKDWWVWYNPQNITENQIILTTNISNSAEDTWELVPILTKFHEEFWAYPSQQVADTWYASEKNYAFLEEHDIQSYIPHQEQQINLNDYTYNQENNTYVDVQWNIYQFKQNCLYAWKWNKWRPKKGVIIDKKDIQSTIYETVLPDGTKKYVSISYNRHELCKRNDDRLYSSDWKEIYRKRSWCIEAVFWNIKSNLWFEKLRLRGFDGATIERNIICLIHNIKKIRKSVYSLA